MSERFQTLYDALIPEEVYDLYDSILSRFDQQDIIIDVGCGTGRLTKRLLNYGHKVYAFDNDQAMIDLASQKVNDVIFKVCDMHEPWPFYGSLICMSQDVLNFSETPLKVLDHAIHALQGEGIILLDMYDVVEDYSEIGYTPFPYEWERKVSQDIIHHKVVLPHETIYIKQYIHPIKTIEKYLLAQGFDVQILPFIHLEKRILIARR